MNSRSPIVSVFMITYNHEKYIAQAIESVLMQKTDFDFEIVIGEDCSTDNTRNIILEYAKKDPAKFKLLLHEKNIGALANQNEVFTHCNGKYIALCEGDDYWTDPLKLQKQVDFLEANADYSICYHRVNYLNQSNESIIESLNTSETEQTYSILDLATRNLMHTCSVVFRRKNINLDIFNNKQVSAGDYVLHMLNARNGLIKYLPEVMAVYRIGVGVWSSLPTKQILKKWILVLDVLMLEFANDIEVNKILKIQQKSIKERTRSFSKSWLLYYRIKYKLKSIFKQ